MLQRSLYVIDNVFFFILKNRSSERKTCDDPKVEFEQHQRRGYDGASPDSRRGEGELRQV